MSNPMKCNICESGDMEHVQVMHTHIYVCNECPNVQLEYHGEKDVNNLQNYLLGKTKKMSTIDKVKYAIGEYIGIPYKYDFDIRLRDELQLLLANEEEIATNVAEQYHFNEELVEAVIEEVLRQR